MNNEQLLKNWKEKLRKLDKEFYEKQKEFEDETEFGEDTSIDMDIERLFGYTECLRLCIRELENVK